MNLQGVVGHWDAGGLAFSIVERDGEFLVFHPDGPAGFEPRLVQAGPDEFMFDGGPYDGGLLSFAFDGDGQALSGSAGGVIPLTRLEHPPDVAPGSGLHAPGVAPDADRDAGFESLWDQIRNRSDGGSIEYQLDAPVHQFVQFLSKRQAIIFHGSNRTDINEFLPLRNSVELHDHGGRGNLGAVYGTHDGLWALFIAIIDRSQIEGSIRNGVSRFSGRDGASIDVYNFSIHYELLPVAPYTNGALYLLPKDSFRRLPMYPGGPLSNEWSCHEPVTPLARLLVTPADFPFLDQIGGHDDLALIELGKIQEEIYRTVVSATRTAGGIRLVTTAPAELVERFIEESGRWLPDIEQTVTHSRAGAVLEMRGPDAFLQGVSRRFANLVGSED